MVEITQVLRLQIRAMDFLGIIIKALVDQQEVVYLVDSSKSKALLILASKTNSLQQAVDFLEGQLTLQINHKIIQEDYLGDNSNKQQEVFLEDNSNKQQQEVEVYLDQVAKQYLAHKATHHMDSLDSPRTAKLLVQAPTKCNKCRHSK